MYLNRKGNECAKPADRISKKRESAYGIYIEKGKALMVKSNTVNLWDFPGGGKEEGENLIEALKRDFFEETGCEIIEFGKKPVYKYKMNFYADDIDEYFDSSMFYFLIKKIVSKQKNGTDTKEIAEQKFVSLEDLNKESMRFMHYEALTKVV